MLSIPADPDVKNFSFTVVNEEVYYRENSVMNRMELPAMTAERVKGMVKIRDVTNELIQCQMEEGSDEQITKLQGKLNEEYDTFTAKYGLLSSNANKRAFSQDSSYCLLTSLEFLDDKGELKRKADIFTKRTIRRAETVTSVDTASEALAVSIGERAGVDLSYMAQLSGKTEEELTEELAGVIFKNPIGEKWEPSDEYLSGNVREKLQIAKQFAEDHPEYQVNVQYLEQVQPKDLDASEIEARLGATWILRGLHYTVYGRDIPYTKILCREQGQSPVCRSDRTVECYGKECGQLRKCSCHFHLWNTESQCLPPFGRCLKP